MNYYLFKLNAGAYTVESFEEDSKKLKSHILDTLNYAISIKKQDKLFKIEIGEDRQNRYLKFIDRYTEIKEHTSVLYEKYEKIIDKYREDGSVSYSNKFIKLNQKCGILRNKLNKDFSFLINAEKIDDEYILKYYDIPTEKPVGTAITHLKKFGKIEYFVENNEISDYFNDNAEIFYDPEKEQVIIRAKDEIDAMDESVILMHTLNNNKYIEEHLGEVTVLPIYKKIELTGQLKKITFSMVYPNGTGDRNDVIFTEKLRKLKADRMRLEISSDQGLNMAEIKSEINSIAQKGYLESIDSIRGGGFRSVISTIDTLRSEENGGL